MSVIIRLQGLPWSANALDIRTYFHGLSIPEGGVHIVGGEQGDAFIAFANDEDARQAMLMDAGRIKDCRVKLLLSSRTEMQKVIDAARTRNLVMQGLVPPTAVTTPTTLPPGMPGAVSMPGAMPGAPMMMTASHDPSMNPAMMAAAMTQQQQQQMYVNRMQMHPQYMQHAQYPGAQMTDPYMAAAAAAAGMPHHYGGVPVGMSGAAMMMKQPVTTASPAQPPLPSYMGGAGALPVESMSADPSRMETSSRGRDISMQQQQQSSQQPNQQSQLPTASVAGLGGGNSNNSSSGNNNNNSGSNIDPPKRGGNDERSGGRDQRSTGRDRDRDRDRDVGRTSGGRRGRERSRSPRRRSRSRDRTVDSFGRNRDNRLPDNNKDSNRGGDAGRRSASQGKQGESGTRAGGGSDMDGSFRGGGGGNFGRGFGGSGGGGLTNNFSQELDTRAGGRLPRGGKEESGEMRGGASRLPFQNGNRAGASQSQPIVLDDNSPHGSSGSSNKRESKERSNNANFTPLAPRPNLNIGGASAGAGTPSAGGGDSDMSSSSARRNSPARSRVSRWGGDNEQVTPAAASENDRARGQRVSLLANPAESREGAGGGGTGSNVSSNANFERPNADRAGSDRSNNRSEQGRDAGGLCVVMRGVPFSVSLSTIREFFEDLPIPPDGVRLPLDDSGRRLPVALVRFADPAARQAGLRLDRTMLHRALVEIRPCPEEDFTSVTAFVSEVGNHSSTNNNNNSQRQIDGSSLNRRHHQVSPPPSDRSRRYPGAGERPSDGTCIHLKGLPFSCRDGDVLHYFKTFHVVDLFIEYDPMRGQATGNGYVEFENSSEARRSLMLDGGTIGRRYIELIQVTKANMEAARARLSGGEDSGNHPRQQHHNNGMDSRHGLQRGGGGGDEMMMMSKKMDESRNMEQQQRGGGLPCPPDRLYAQQPPDCCLVTGLPPDAIDRDLLEFFAPVNVVPTAIHLMLSPNGPPPGHAFCEFANEIDCKRALQQDGAPVRPGSRLTLGVSPVSRRELEQTVGKKCARPQDHPMGGGGGPFVGGGGGRVSPQQMGGDFRGGPGNFGPQPHMPGRFNPGPPIDRVPIENFGRPGCVVQLGNIPFRANVEDIMNFFQGFELSPKQIIRRFEEDRSPSGDARISFPTPADASAAIHQFNGQVMFGRVIKMHLHHPF